MSQLMKKTACMYLGNLVNFKATYSDIILETPTANLLLLRMSNTRHAHTQNCHAFNSRFVHKHNCHAFNLCIPINMGSTHSHTGLNNITATDKTALFISQKLIFSHKMPLLCAQWQLFEIRCLQ